MVSVCSSSLLDKSSIDELTVAVEIAVFPDELES